MVEPRRLASLPTWLLSQAATRAHRLLYERLAEAGYTGYQYRVLVSLAESGEQSQAEIGRAVSLDRRDVTHTVRGLEQIGLVARRAHATHGRVIIVVLTARGRDVFAEMDVVMQGIQDDFLGVLTPSEQAELARLLSKLHDRAARACMQNR